MNTCLSCAGTGKVKRMIGVDNDYYPVYGNIKCPACSGRGTLDMGELFIVPRGMIKDEFFVATLYTEAAQAKLRTVLLTEEKFLDKIK